MDWLFRSSDGPPKPTEALGTATEKGKRSCQQQSNAATMQPNVGSSCSKLMSQSAAPPRSWPFLKVGQFWQTKLSGWRTSRKTKASKAASVRGLFHIRPSLRCRLLAHFGPDAMSDLSPLSGVKRKLDFGAVGAAFDPKTDIYR